MMEKLRLYSGGEIDAFLKEETAAPINNEMELDTTGRYFQIKKKPMGAVEIEEAVQKGINLFVDNAFFLYSHANRIKQDSRMFLTPVPIQSGLAYTGTSGFRRPTLGVYIEWWETFDSAVVVGDSGDMELLYYLAGSPLSGSNRCSSVDKNGKRRVDNISSFHGAWSSFMKINTNYDEAKQKYQYYTLQEVIDILKAEKSNPLEEELFDLKNKYRVAGICNKQLTGSLSYYKQRCSDLNDKLYEALIRLHLPEVKTFYEEYKKRETDLEEALAGLSEKKRLFKLSLRNNPILPKDAQAVFSGIKKQRQILNKTFENFKEDSLKDIFQEEVVPLHIIREFIEKEQAEKTL